MRTTLRVWLVLFFAVSSHVANGQAVPAVTRGSREDFRLQAEAQRWTSELQEAWRTSKKLTFLEKLPEWPRNESECLSVARLDNDDVGYLEYWHFRVLQVVGPNDLILSLKNPDIAPIWLTGYSTNGLADGDQVRLVGLVEVTGTRTYQTAAGATKTVRVVRLVSRDRMARVEAKLQADRKAAEAKAKATQEALVWRDRWAKERRTWKDKTGSFSVEAVYDGFLGDGKIRLLREDRSQINVHLSKLSDADRRKAVELRKAGQK